MSSATVTSRNNDGRKKRKVSHVLPPKGSKKFTEETAQSACDRLHVAIDGGEIRERSCKSYAPLARHEDPATYWRMVDAWAVVLAETAANMLAELQAATFTLSDGTVLTGKAARLERAKRERSAYVQRKQIERSTKDPRVHTAIANDESALADILANASPEALQRLLAAAQGKVGAE